MCNLYIHIHITYTYTYIFFLFDLRVFVLIPYSVSVCQNTFYGLTLCRMTTGPCIYVKIFFHILREKKNTAVWVLFGFNVFYILCLLLLYINCIINTFSRCKLRFSYFVISVGALWLELALFSLWLYEVFTSCNVRQYLHAWSFCLRRVFYIP